MHGGNDFGVGQHRSQKAGDQTGKTMVNMDNVRLQATQLRTKLPEFGGKYRFNIQGMQCCPVIAFEGIRITVEFVGALVKRDDVFSEFLRIDGHEIFERRCRFRAMIKYPTNAYRAFFRTGRSREFFQFRRQRQNTLPPQFMPLDNYFVDDFFCYASAGSSDFPQRGTEPIRPIKTDDV